MSILVEVRQERDKLKQKLEEITHKRDTESLPFSMAFLLPRQLAHILRAVYMEPNAVSRDEVLSIITLTGRSAQVQSARVVDVAICRLNKRLKEHGLRVRNLRGVGFYFNAQDKAAIKKIMAA
jgi:DNA-binding response OmpR family regulator